MDIVLNHCNNKSEWLANHPNAAYTLENSPYLNAAYVLDQAIMQFSHDYAECKISSCVRAPFIENEEDLKKMIEVMKFEVIDKLYMHEFFHINVAETVKKMEAFMKDPVNIDPYSPVNKAIRDIIKDNLSFKVSEIDLLLRNM